MISKQKRQKRKVNYLELENIFNIGSLLGICKIWIGPAGANKSTFFQGMPAPLNMLKTKLENLEIQEGTIKEIEEIIKLCNEVMFIVHNELKKEEEKSKKEVEKLNNKLDQLNKNIKDELTKRIPIWEDRIINKLIKTKVVKLSTNTNLNPEKLSLGAELFFDINIWNKMSNLEKSDLEDGCRCISLQAWTPAGMITMRVIESVLRNYYQKETSNTPTGKMWGQMLTDLKSIPSANQKLVGYFEYLKDIRNSLQHPEERLSQFESEDVFHHAIHILNIFYS